ncbi:MAG: hypothetical protein HQL66_15380 [Magnetococcales bacterium]|nr:hypothetical protein [Magnetococcales bacterium]
MSLIILSLLLAYGLNRYVEEPIRRIEVKARMKAVGLMIIGSVAVVGTTIGMMHVTAVEDHGLGRLVNYGLHYECDFTRTFKPTPQCQRGNTPEFLVWGDSHAMHLVQGMTDGGEKSPAALVQATKLSCSPLFGMAPVFVGGKGAYDWARDCMTFNASVLNYLRQADTPMTVVLSSRFNHLLRRFDDGTPVNVVEGMLVEDADGNRHLAPADTATSIVGLKKTIEAIRAMGKRVVFVAPPPASGFDIGRCTERLVEGLPVIGGARDCNITVRAYHATRRDVLDLLAAIEADSGIEVIRFDRYLCNGDSCKSRVGGIPIYGAGDHLSQTGSAHLGKAISLLERIRGKS